MGASPNNFNIPASIVNSSDAMTVINVFYDSLNKSLAVTDFVETLVEETKAFVKEVKSWKAKNTVEKCKHMWVYSPDGTNINTTGEIPEGKTLSKDQHKCTE